MLDGGLWSNNPIMNALVDALACYDLERRQVRILSLGCGETAFTVGDTRAKGGLLHWWPDIFFAALRAQSLNALGQAYLLVGKDQVMRLDAPPRTPTRSDWTTSSARAASCRTWRAAWWRRRGIGFPRYSSAVRHKNTTLPADAQRVKCTTETSAKPAVRAA